MLSIWCSQPADGRVIRVLAVILFLLWLSIATLCLRVSHYYSQLPSGPNSNYAQYCLTWFLFVPLNLACSVFLAKSIYTHAERCAHPERVELAPLTERDAPLRLLWC